MMLIGLSLLLNVDALHALYARGHRDSVAAVDANFFPDTVTEQARTGKLHSMETVVRPRAIKDYCLTANGELRFYGCFLPNKGINVPNQVLIA